MPNQPVILVVEDRDEDLFMLQRAFSQLGFDTPVQYLRDGEEAIAYLRGEGRFVNRDEFPMPTVMLLDLKMPRKNGFEVLQWLREQPQFTDLQVVVLSSSDEIRDINRAYELGANSFLVKPMFFSEFVGMLEALHSYCLRVWQQEDRSRARAPVRAAAVGI